MYAARTPIGGFSGFLNPSDWDGKKQGSEYGSPQHSEAEILALISNDLKA